MSNAQSSERPMGIPLLLARSALAALLGAAGGLLTLFCLAAFARLLGYALWVREATLHWLRSGAARPLLWLLWCVASWSAGRRAAAAALGRGFLAERFPGDGGVLTAYSFLTRQARSRWPGVPQCAGTLHALAGGAALLAALVALLVAASSRMGVTVVPSAGTGVAALAGLLLAAYAGYSQGSGAVLDVPGNLLRSAMEDPAPLPSDLPPEDDLRPKVLAANKAWMRLNDLFGFHGDILRLVIGYRRIDLADAQGRIEAFRTALGDLPDGCISAEARAALAEVERRLQQAWPRWRGRVPVRALPFSGYLLYHFRALHQLGVRLQTPEERQWYQSARARMPEIPQTVAPRDSDWRRSLLSAAGFVLLLHFLHKVRPTIHRLPGGPDHVLGWFGVAFVLGPVVGVVVWLWAMQRRMRVSFLPTFFANLGARARRLTAPERRERCPGATHALLIEAIEPGSRAGQMGLQVGDCVVALRGLPLDRFYSGAGPDAPRTVTVIRAHAQVEIPFGPPTVSTVP
jgi:hypothetical protein